MKARHWHVGCAAIVGLGLATAVVRSDEKDGGQGQPQMSAEDQKMMEAYMKAGEPGPQHERLAKMVGKWDTDVQFWYQPDAPAEQSKGSAEFRPILGGRFIEQVFHGTGGGMEFEGRGVCGFDNLKKKYTSLWMDSMSTSTLMMTGDEAKGDIVTYGEEIDPLGTKWKLRAVMKQEGPDRHGFEMYKTGPDGKEFKCLQIVYTRSAGGSAAGN